ncbi:hypothetical protein EST38_g2844 [Candolleomyces aberdarensis]|uniref:Uncharacterized protein n=1 Tax=Candolleomyces aberdarensis TaxID=2316362 RepID=A0A4V1Q4R5_9AGAR|nr:hypothetical protein EST38_g2844 [Candolleomyces aberdarensis]
MLASNISSGVFQVVHGFGENIRGTFLGAFDTMTHETSGRNDQIAREGRLEIQRGMERLGRGTGNATTGTATTGMTTTNAPSYPNTYNEPQAAANDSMFRRPAAAYKAEVPTDAPVAPGPAGYSTGASYGYPHGHDKAPHL